MTTTAYVDLAFPVRGQTLPRDHGYALYSALSRALPIVHGADWIAIHGIAARGATPELLDLSGTGQLKLRISTERIAPLLALTGLKLVISGHAIRLGSPTVHPLQPAASLDARLVVIRLTGGVEKPFDRVAFEGRFEAEAKRQLERLGVVAELALRGHQDLRVGSQRVMGYSMRVIGLSLEHSLALQIHGIGGKRTMGCGIFRPTRRHVVEGAAA